MTVQQMIDRLKELPADRQVIVIPGTVIEGEEPVQYNISFYYGAFNLKSRFHIYQEGFGIDAIHLTLTYDDE